jgi:hypothetical protein
LEAYASKPDSKPNRSEPSHWQEFKRKQFFRTGRGWCAIPAEPNAEVSVMPDPGLTDLIAAHYRHCVSEEIRLDPETGVHTKWIECTCVCGADTSVEVTGDREAAVRLADAAHVALVVEQHTNGRITELEVAVEHWKDRSQYNYDCGMVLANEANARAERAEATIYRVKNALPNVEGINPASSHYDKGWDRGQQILTEHIQSAITGDYTRAALEGEQQ